MKVAGLSENVRVFYKDQILGSGESIIFNIWNENGTQLLTNQPATEIGTEGVYYLNYTAPNSAQYLLVIGSKSDGTYPQPSVIRVGSPAAKAFYIHGAFTAGLDIAYEVYDSAGAVLTSGSLQSVVNGFYYADVDGLATPWFLEVPPLAIKNQDDLPAK